MATSRTGSAKDFHPLYSEHQADWIKARDVFEGTGGFTDVARPYLWAHPREWDDHSLKTTDQGTIPNPDPQKPSAKLKARRKMARYENVAEIIISGVIGALFRVPTTRTFPKDTASEKPRLIQTWWANADGKGTPLDQIMRDAWTVAAAVAGHTVLMVDKSGTTAATLADTAAPVVRSYTALDVIDWLTDDTGHVTAVKLLEPAPRLSFESVLTKDDLRVRVVTEKDWALYDKTGKRIDGAEHGMGRLPIVFLYAKRRPMTPVIGKSIMGDPNLYIDLYNLHSEVRELLRNQTFAILNVPVGKDGSPDEEMKKIGSQGGTANVLFSSEAIGYVSPEGTNVQVYHEHIDRLGRSIYRLAAAPWQSDTRDAESADSLLIKRDEQQTVLSKYAAELQRADDELTELFYRARFGERWEHEREREQPTTRYPEKFHPPDVTEIATLAGEALGLDLGPAATKEVKKRTVRHVLPGAPPELLKTIDGEIDGQDIKSADERRQELLNATAARFGQKTEEPPPVEEPKEPAA